MISTDFIFGTQLVLGVLLVLIWIRLRGFEKKTDKVIKEVTDYLNYIATEEAEPEEEEKKEFTREKKTQQDAIKSHLIQSVLGEYFP